MLCFAGIFSLGEVKQTSPISKNNPPVNLFVLIGDGVNRIVHKIKAMQVVCQLATPEEVVGVVLPLIPVLG